MSSFRKETIGITVGMSSQRKNICSLSSFRKEMIGITVGMSESAWECLRMPEDAWGCLRLSLNRFRPYLGSPKLYIIIVILESSSRQRGLNFGPVPLRRLGALRSWTYGQNAANTHFVSATGMHLKTLHAPTFSLSQNVVAHPGFSTSRHQREGGVGPGDPNKHCWNKHY